MQKSNLKNRIIGIVGLFISVILIIRFSDISTYLIILGEKHLSSDNHFNYNTVIELKILVIYFILLTTTLCVLLILNSTKYNAQYFNIYFQNNHVIKLFLIDDICSKKQLSLYILLIGTLHGFLLLLYLLSIGEPSFEGILEKGTSLLYLFSVIILIIAIVRINKVLYSSRTRRGIILSIIVISGILLIIFGEEISWGQRIFGWETSSIFIEYNYQDETNVHNFFNPIFKYIYPIVGIGSFFFLFFVWFFPKKKKSYLFNLFFPHPSLFFLVSIMAYTSFHSIGQETFEELFAIFFLLYSFRIFMCLRFPKIVFSNHQKY